MTEYYTLGEVIEAMEEARENWDDHVHEDDDARIAARIGAATVLKYLDTEDN